MCRKRVYSMKTLKLIFENENGIVESFIKKFKSYEDADTFCYNYVDLAYDNQVWFSWEEIE